MDTRAIIFLLAHLGDLRKISLGQWLSVVGSAIAAFGVALASDPGHYQVAAGAAAGTALVALVHLLQPSPSQRAKTDGEKDKHDAVDADDRIHM